MIRIRRWRWRGTTLYEGSKASLKHEDDVKGTSTARMASKNPALLTM